jgi:alanyl-tRNA synthetase
MKTNDIRQKYLDFFKRKDHVIVSSDSLVPHNDPTLLFTGAGMNQFKDYFLGLKKDLKRATSSQKCLRTGDLDEVGRTAFHHSFFEMLGNFSFGDYFKKEAIYWAWEFLTVELKIAKERLRISVHESDDEAYKIWKDEIKIRPDWIYKMGDKSNFWPSNAPKDGPNGPCGPCSEIYYDQDPKQGDGGHIDDGTGRFAEIWNLVFTQFDRQDGGKLVPLAQKNIDTGMGLERLACVLQGKQTNYEIDIFQPINQEIQRLLNISPKTYSGPHGPDFFYKNVYAIADHARAIVFSLSDGVIPSNEGRGYVIRKLIRRALYRAHILTMHHLEQPFLYQLVGTIAIVMHQTYPELKEAEASLASTLKGEEERFISTLETGLEILTGLVAKLEEKGAKTLAGETAFELYDTYGFPYELTRDIAAENDLYIDEKEFNRLMEEQRKRAKDASKMSGNIFVTSELEEKLMLVAPTKFLGYNAHEADAKVLFADIKEGKGIVALDQSPFYGESGGQVGDQGVLRNPSFEARVVDTQKKENVVLHRIEIQKGLIAKGDAVHAAIDQNRRERAMRNHTATHLLHAALRNILGNQVRQLGSLVAPEKLRFDYSYSQALTADQIKQIEDSVNAEILKDTDVTKEEKNLEDAKKEGALAFFGEKYGKTVRVVSIPGFSKEFCGGTHCNRTGQIGAFVIVSDSSIASGTRRIEALTGEGALDYLRTLRTQMNQLAQTLKTTPAELPTRVAKLQESVKKLEKQAGSGYKTEQAVPSLEKKIGETRITAQVFKDLDVNSLRKISDDLRLKNTKAVYLIGSEKEDKAYFILGLSHDLVKSGIDLREVGKGLAELLNGNSGGRADLIQGGAQNQGQFNSQGLDKILNFIADSLKEKVS